MRQLSGHPIAVRSVGRDFGCQHALSDIDLMVAAGEVHGLLGPARAGKSTLLRVLAGQLCPSSGRMQVRGRIAFVEADDSTHRRISGLEDLVFYGRLQGLPEREALRRAEAVLHEADLGDAARGPVGEWTPGMRRRLAFARALLNEPGVLLIDAPACEPEPEIARRLAIGRARHGAAVVWAAQRLDQLAGAADAVTLLAGGRIRYSGSVSALADRSTQGWSIAEVA